VCFPVALVLAMACDVPWVATVAFFLAPAVVVLLAAGFVGVFATGFFFAVEAACAVAVEGVPVEACATSLSPAQNRDAKTAAIRNNVILSSIPSRSSHRLAKGKLAHTPPSQSPLFDSKAARPSARIATSPEPPQIHPLHPGQATIQFRNRFPLPRPIARRAAPIYTGESGEQFRSVPFGPCQVSSFYLDETTAPFCLCQPSNSQSRKRSTRT